MNRAVSRRPRLLVPEVIQTSTMDCGPAALTSVLGGFGIRVGYERIREICRTAIDGTAIEAIEEAANIAGLDAVQIMQPSDHLKCPGSGASRAIIAIKAPSGAAHFVVLWGTVAGYAQIMDPARGRRWLRWADLQRELFSHSAILPASEWHRWALTPGFITPLSSRLSTVGVPPQRYIDAVRGSTWQALATLDAAVRSTEALVAGGSVQRGGEAIALIDRLLSLPTPELLEILPGEDWTARPHDGELGNGPERIVVTGSVFVSIRKRDALSHTRMSPSDDVDGWRAKILSAVAEGAAIGPVAQLFEVFRELGAGVWWLVLAAIFVCASVTVFEGLLFKGVLDIWAQLGVMRQRIAAVVAVMALLLAAVAIEFSLAFGLRRLGGRLEHDLRRRMARKVARISDSYFRTRPLSDLVERAHKIDRLRGLPIYIGQSGRTFVEAILIVSGICWIRPSGTLFIVTSVCVMLAIPWIARRRVTEHDVRVRILAGALSRQFLDVLLGLVTIRAHRTEAAVEVEHEARLSEWVRATAVLQQWNIGIDGAQSFVAALLAFYMLSDLHSSLGYPGLTLLLVYWVSSMPVIGRQIAYIAAQYPGHRNVAARLLETLNAPEAVPPADGPIFADNGEGLSISFKDVTIEMAGREILNIDALDVPAGSHVAIVGPSGAGKSTMVAALLGWCSPAAGTIEVGGRRLDEAILDHLRSRTVWIDPSVQVWNATLIENVLYGSGHGTSNLTEALSMANLDEVLGRLPTGMQTRVGDSGGLLSGGESQRVRFARALMQERPRLVLMDEAFRGLERARRTELLARARHRWATATIVCVSHDVDASRDFDLVVVIDQGRVVECGKPSDLEANAGARYRALLDEQSRVDGVWRDGWRRLTVEDGQITDVTVA